MLLITGGRGQLGTALTRLLPQARSVGSDELDICDGDAVARYVKSNDIDVIINCAAYTAVDRAEEEPHLAERVNVLGPGNLARSGAAIIHFSTDYVFDGDSAVPYTESMPVAPLSVYGSTKLRGEREVLGNADVALVIRTGWLYSPYRANFLKTMLRLASERDTVRVVSDQTGTPTSCFDLANAAVAALPGLSRENKGIYHYSNEGACSWYDFADEIMRQCGLPCRVVPIGSAEYPTRAVRPKYSVLDKTKFKSVFGTGIPHWKEGLRACLQQF